MLPGLSFRVKKATVCLRGAHPFFLSMMYFVRHCHFHRFLCISNMRCMYAWCTSFLSPMTYSVPHCCLTHHSYRFLCICPITNSLMIFLVLRPSSITNNNYYCTHDHPALTSCYDTPTVPPWCTSIIFETITRLHWCQCSSSAIIVAHLCQYSLSKSTGEKMMMNTYTQADLMPPYDSDDSS